MKRLFLAVLLALCAVSAKAQNNVATLTAQGSSCPTSPGSQSSSSSYVTQGISGPTGSVAFGLAGLSSGAGTVSFYGSANNGATWSPLTVTSTSGGGAVSSTTAPGSYNNSSVGAITNFCALLTSASGGVSVTVTVQLSLAGGSSSNGGGASASYYQATQQSTVPLTPRAAINFLSPLVITDDAPNNSSDVTCGNCLNVVNNAQNANQVTSGGIVEWTGNYNFTVGAAQYTISGVGYSSPLTNITLATPDPSNDRIDVIMVNNQNAVAVITGTPAATPVQPTVDPTTQLELTFVYVSANTTAPTQITKVDIYHSNTEWTTARSPATAVWNLASTNFPYDTTVDIEATNVALNNYVSFLYPSSQTVDLGTVNNLVMYIRSKASWSSARSLTLQWYNGATAKGQAVVVRDGTFGFSSSVTGAYQQVSVPTNLFGIAGVLVTTLRITVSGTGTTTIGFYLDDITLQGGNTTTTLPTGVMLYRNTWASTTAYNAYDTVSYSGALYVASQASTNQTPAVGSSYWTQVGVTTLNTICEGGLGDGLNAIAAGTYLQTTCYNGTGKTVTITGVKCYVDNASGTSSTLGAAGNTLGNLVNATNFTCGNSTYGAATQSANVALTSGDYVKFTFVADGTTKQTDWVVLGTVTY